MRAGGRALRPGVRHRLLLAVVAAVGVGLAASLAAYELVVDRQLTREATSLARERAQVALEGIDTTGGRVDAGAAAAVDDLAALVWVYEGGRRLVGPDAAGAALEEAAAALADGTPSSARVGEEAQLAAVPVLSGGTRIGTVVAAVALAPYERSSHAVLVTSIVLAGVLLVTVTLISGWMLRRALRPVARMTAEAEAWSVTDLERRFGLGAPHDEITQLGATLDRLLDRIAAALRHEQRFTAELSHEIRTPLARIAAEAELALSRERRPEEYREALTAIAADAAELAATTEALVAAARTEAGLAREPCDAREAAENVVASLAPLAAARGVGLELLPGGPAGVPAEPALVERLLAPLVENACRYAASTVTVTVSAGPSTVVVDVADDGPGVTPGEEDAIFEPGARGSAAPAHEGGSGLGLSLARRLARSGGGDVAAVPGRGGGRFRVTLPAA